MDATRSNRRAITLQCGVFRETTIYEDHELSVFQELVYFFLDNKVILCIHVLRVSSLNILLECL